MSLDIVALVADRPDPAQTLTGMTGPRGPLDVRLHNGATHLHDPDGPLLVSVESPVLVQVEGEVKRLLDVQVPGPVWWVDIRAAAEPAEAAALGRAIADEFVRRHGGMVWTGTRG
jgi:hypothetical protein